MNEPKGAPAAVAPIPVTVSNRVETLSTEFVMGWASVSASNRCSHVFAMLGGEIIGCGVADLTRPDLDRARTEGRYNAFGFLIVFDKPVPAASLQSIQVFVMGQPTILSHAITLKIDSGTPLRVFVLGSPRSGTSELGATLSKVLKLPWLGEGHAAPLFAHAADALTGDVNDANGLVRFLAQQNFRRIPIEAARRAYFHMHNSASFIDKTPGVAMVKAAPFLNECFPGSFYVYLRRNPVANVLSRMVKFGGNFEAHCRDWATAMNEWAGIRTRLPHYVEIQQEEMLNDPQATARMLASYLSKPDEVDAIAQSLREGSLEKTGAGIGKSRSAETNWTSEQLRQFERWCRPTMREFGYE